MLVPVQLVAARLEYVFGQGLLCLCGRSLCSGFLGLVPVGRAADGLLVGSNRSEESLVLDGESAAPVQHDGVLVKVACLYHGALFVPFQLIVHNAFEWASSRPPLPSLFRQLAQP